MNEYQKGQRYLMVVNNFCREQTERALANAIKRSNYPMCVYTDDADISEERAYKLANTPIGTGHDNFLVGITVDFDLTFSIKAWTEIQRYHFIEIISSQSTMHRLKNMDVDFACNEYVTYDTKRQLLALKCAYNECPSEQNFLRMIYNCPVGFKLTAGITTNYRQLKTIYHQRKTHRLPEWREFCKWIETLPMAKELICGERK